MEIRALVISSKYYPVEEERWGNQLEELFRTLRMIKVIEDCYRSDISTRLQRLKGLVGFKTADNADCSQLQSVESLKQILRSSIAEVITEYCACAWSTMDKGKEWRLFGRERAHLCFHSVRFSQPP